MSIYIYINILPRDPFILIENQYHSTRTKVINEVGLDDKWRGEVARRARGERGTENHYSIFLGRLPLADRLQDRVLYFLSHLFKVKEKTCYASTEILITCPCSEIDQGKSF